ncbi:acyl-CoA thioesterase [Rhodoferax koreense]|uniref:Acyl-CoA thioesterase n=1 Tax=Rhodoferax koreensis TaxID=1842727 RepID=A0A1P8JS41_9BURK|nr:thioesterase family protein [Rhodoferax koreense]APW36551.1 acyl-CoA thioesterase [Rhodoferax koreense]
MGTTHFLDQALKLEAAPADADHYTGTASPAYWNMVGPFGGTTAATVLQAVMQHPKRLGEPIALTVNYGAALGPGAFTVTARAVRTNRSTQHWRIDLSQADAEGAPQLVTTATAVTAARRDTWGVSDMPMPSAPLPHEVESSKLDFRVEWPRRYDMRAILGDVPTQWNETESQADPAEASLTRLWVRDEPPRPIDFPALAAMADVFYPRAWLRRPKLVPAGTVSFTVYFHADSALLDATGDGHLLAQARAQAFRNGFFDQSAQLWNQAGALLATSHQIVYYKE